MGLYSALSLLLTGVGYILLTYRSSFILSQNPEAKRELLQPLGMKWIVFLLFLMFEPSLETIMDIIPFGLIVLLAIKCMLVLPENTLATHIYKKIQKRLERMEFEQYNSKVSQYASTVCKMISIKAIKAAKTLAVYVKRDQLQDVYIEIESTLKALEYKRMTVGAKHEMGKSVNTGLDDTLGSIDPQEIEDHEKAEEVTYEKQPEVFSRMSVYVQPAKKPADQGAEYKVKADIMTVKPNKQKNIKPKYQKGQITFNSQGNRIQYSYLESGRQHRGVLMEIKYVKVNMMVIELIMENDNSVVIKFLDEQDVFPWVKPVMSHLSAK